MYHSLKFMSFQARQTWHVKEERDYLHAAREEEGLLYSSAFSPFLQLEILHRLPITFSVNRYMGLQFFILSLIVGSEIKFWLGAKVVLDVVSHFELT